MADGTVKILTDLSTEGFQKGLSRMGSIAKTGLKAVTTSVTAVGAALGGMGAYAVKTGMDFDSSMSQVSATLGITKEQIEGNLNGAGDTFDMLREKALEMGSATNFTATEAAEGLNILAMSGYSAEESVSMIEDVLHLSAAGAMDMGNAAGYVAGAMKGFSDETKGSAYYADLMAKGATLANTNVQQLGEAMSDGAAVASSYGQSAESMTIALLRLAEQGDTGSNAATALAAAMKNLYAPTDQAKAIMAELGVNAFDPTTGKARDFNDVVNDLNGALSGYSDEQKTAYAQTIFGIQGFDAYNKMVVTSTTKQEEWSKALAESTGEAAKQYNTMTDNLQGDIDILQSAMSGLGISISDSITPNIREMVQTGTEYLGQLQKAFDDGGIAGAVAALGDIFAEIAVKIADSAPAMIDTAVSFITNFLSGLQGSLPQLAASAVTIGESLLSGLLEIIPQVFVMGAQFVVDFAQGAVKALPELVRQGVQMVDTLCSSIASSLPQLITAAQQAIPWLVNGLAQALPRVVDAGAQVISSLISGLAGALPTLIPAAVDIIVSVYQALVDNLPLLLDAGLQLLQGLAQGIIQAIPVLIKALPKLIQGIVDFIVDGIPMLIDAAIQLINGIVAALPEIISTLIDALPQIIESLVSGLISCIGQLVAGAIQLVVALVTHIPEIIAALIAAIPEIVTAIIDGFVNSLDSFVETGGQIIDALGQGISDAWAAIVKYFTVVIPNLISSIGTWFSELPGKVGEWLTATLNNVISWAASLWSKAQEAGQNFLNGVVNFVKTLPENIWSWLQNTIGKVASFVTTFAAKALEAGKSFFTNIVNTVSEIPGKMLEIGGNIVSGIWSGISNGFGWLMDQLSNFCGWVVDGVKSLFGINSPSRVMAESVGRYLPPGIAQGFEEAVPAAADKIQDSLDGLVDDIAPPVIPIDVAARIKDSGTLDHLRTAVEASSAKITATVRAEASERHPAQPQTNGDMKFEQVNNFYTSGVLSPAESARQTRNATRQMLNKAVLA